MQVVIGVLVVAIVLAVGVGIMIYNDHREQRNRRY